MLGAYGRIFLKALFDKVEDARSLAQIIVDAVREPLLALDGDFNILFASGSFYRLFQIDPDETRDPQLFVLDNGTWDIPALRTLLEDAVPGLPAIEQLEITHEFPRIGERILLLRARKALYDGDTCTVMLLHIEDITGRRAIEREKDSLQQQTDDLLRQKEVLLQEMQHRIVNSLQIIASILMLKARAVTSEETRQHLQDAHRRVMSVATVQQYLHNSGRADMIEMAPYLTKLCDSLAESMISDSRAAALHVVADKGTLLSADAVSVGLIVTELVINALKYAFPDPSADASVIVRYEVNGTDWKLSVSDNGVGKPDNGGKIAKGGLGTSLVQALAHQLDAQVQTTGGKGGVSISITHATFTSRSPLAA